MQLFFLTHNELYIHFYEHFVILLSSCVSVCVCVRVCVCCRLSVVGSCVDNDLMVSLFWW